MLNIVLKDRSGNPVTHTGVNAINVLLDNGSEAVLSQSGADYFITYMSIDGTEELYVKPIMYGDTAGDVIALGLMDEPIIKTEELEYTFLGWSDSIGGEVKTSMFESVTENRTVYAVYEVIEPLATGECGESATWRLMPNGTLTISGEGAMDDYEAATDQPWNAYADDVTKVIVKDGITHVGKRSFNLFTNLTEAEIAESVVSLGTHIFSGCSNLTAANIPNNVTSIPASLFNNCSGLTSITIPDGVTSIGDFAFYNCTNLTSIHIPDGVTSIGKQAFYGCSELTSIHIPDGVTSISYAAFYNCTNLTTVNIPDGVTSIGDFAFQNSNIVTITIPDGVTSIGKQAFYNCTSLVRATFKNTNGWRVSTSATSTSGTSLSATLLADANTAASYLRNTYALRYWKRI